MSMRKPVKCVTSIAAGSAARGIFRLPYQGSASLMGSLYCLGRVREA
jgi:hypothetical protein